MEGRTDACTHPPTLAGRRRPEAAGHEGRHDGTGDQGEGHAHPEGGMAMTALSSLRSAAGPGRRPAWTAARIACALVGALLALCSLGLLGGGGAAVWESATQRHGGDIDLGTWSYHGDGYALASSTADMFGATSGWPGPRSLLGTAQDPRHISQRREPGLRRNHPGRRRPPLPGRGRFNTVRGLTHHHATYAAHSGGAPVAAPIQTGIWVTRASGPGTQTLTWPARPGNWTGCPVLGRHRAARRRGGH